MDWKARLAEPDEVGKAIDLSAAVFGAGPAATPDYRAQVGAMLEPDRTFVVDDGGAVVGTGSAFTYDLALPGATVPMSAVTEVGVAPTHRRQGILRAIMGALVDQAIDRGEPVAGLTASEGTIYRRFGFGVASRFQSLAIDRSRSAELVDHSVAGRFRLVAEAEAATLMPEVWARHWPRVPGEVSRTDGWWRSAALDPESDRDGASARYIAVHEDAGGAADGFAVYRQKENWRAGTGLDLFVEDVAAVDDAVEAAMVRFLLDVDLVSTVRWWAAPVDHPLWWRLADPRAIQVNTERDFLWLRPLDVARCLGARRYAAEGSLVIEVVDGARPELGGRFRLDVGAGGAEASAGRTEDDADLVVAMPDLGAALLGGVPWGLLRRAGLVGERRAGAVALADALFRPERAPYCGTGF